MSKFTFIKQPEDDNWLEEGDSKLTTEFSAVTLDRVLEEFELFLKGSGFVFDGHLDFVQDKSSFDDDLDDIEQFFGKAKETDATKTPAPWPFTNITVIKDTSTQKNEDSYE